MSSAYQARNRKSWREINREIYRNVVLYLIGPKFEVGYVIDASRSSSRNDAIRIPGDYNRYGLTLYFGFRISLSAFGAYYILQDDDMEAPDGNDRYEYIRIVTAFLREYIRHVTRLQKYCMSYPRMHADSQGYFIGGATGIDASGCPEVFAGDIACHELLARHKYDFRNLDDVTYITGVMRSKQFRRSRGDYE